MAILLFGYDVERQIPEYWPETQQFLKFAPKIHKELGVPCTYFCCGKTVENNINAFKKALELNPDIDIQQHTYSHILLKSVLVDYENGKKEFFEGAPTEDIHREVEVTSKIIKIALGKDVTGLTGPYGYYMGLSDRPDILKILHQCGIRFTRTYARTCTGYQPVSYDIKPFTYDIQGYPDILEFPVHGWQDFYWRDNNGWDNLEGYLNYLKSQVDMLAETDLVWCYVQHDWTSIINDPGMETTSKFLEYAMKKGITPMTYKDYYLKMLGKDDNVG